MRSENDVKRPALSATILTFHSAETYRRYAIRQLSRCLIDSLKPGVSSAERDVSSRSDAEIILFPGVRYIRNT